MKEISGALTADGCKIALVVSRFNSFLTEQLVKGAVDAFVRLGGDEECEVLGDIFYLGEMTEPDYALALSLYEKGAAKGNYGCQRKLKMLHEERERCYIEATRIERSSPDEAFKLFKKSVELGYLPAHARIGWLRVLQSTLT